MEAVTTPVTPGLVVHVPDVEVSSVNIEGQQINVQFKKASRMGPFGGAALVERLVAGKKDSEHVRLLEKYNYLTRQLPGSALKEFTEIRRPQEAAAFVQKYGPLAGWSGLAMPFDFVVQQREQFSAILWLNKAVAETNKEDIKECLKDAAQCGLDIISDPSQTIAFHLTKHLAPALPALLPVEGGLQAVLICPDVMTGLYGLLLSAVAESRPWQLCENCRQPFQTSRTVKRFCSEPCQQAAKQRRYRQSNQSKPSRKTKGSTHGRQRSTKR